MELIDVEHALAQLARLPGQVDVLDPHVHGGVAVVHVPQVERAGERPRLGADRQLARDIRAETAEEERGCPSRWRRAYQSEPRGEDEQEEEREQQAERQRSGRRRLRGGGEEAGAAGAGVGLSIIGQVRY